jgi:hypothetical protein
MHPSNMIKDIKGKKVGFKKMLKHWFQFKRL